MRSKFEEEIYKELCKKYGKRNVEYESETLHYLSSYYPDFTITRDGVRFFVETKGYFRPKDRSKMRLVKEFNPEIDLRIIFQKDNYYTPTMNYSKWAEKNGIQYAIGNDFKRLW